MKKGMFSKLLPHLIAVVIFLVVAVLYCSPALSGKVLNQSDVLHWKGMAQQSFEFKEKYGRFPLWTNSLFSGMPAYTIAMEGQHPNITGYLYYVLTLGLPIPLNYFFLSCVCFYFLCCVLRINPWLGMMAALAYAYSTFDPIIVSVGHDTQMQAIGLAPAVIGSLMLILKKNYLWGAGLLSIFFGFQTGTQHLQIVYYTGIMVGFIVIAFAVYSYKRNEIRTAILSLVVALVAAGIGFFSSAVSMLPLREYAKETMRGGQSALSDVSNGTNKTKGGLNKDYAFQWSYGIGETFTIMVPGIYGGSNGGKEHKSATTFSGKLTEMGWPEDQALQMANSNSYWGEQELGTSGPVYLGAVICFLFIFAMVYLKNWNKWWIIAASVLSIMMAWGKHFAGFNYFLFDYLPLYNKFRAPTMSLVIPQFTFPLAGALAVNQLIHDPQAKANLWKYFKTATFVTAGIIGLLVIMYFTFSYRGSNDAQLKSSFANAMLSQAAKSGQATQQVQQQAEETAQTMAHAIQDDRKSLYGGDLLRSIVFIGLAVLLLAGYLKSRIKLPILLGGLLLLSSLDVLAVGRRYLNDDSFVEPADFDSYYAPTEADQQILADTHKPFRVLDETDQGNGPFQSARASYFFNSVGGYHPAKLSVYQDLIERQLSKGNMEVYNMLNTRYFIALNPNTGKPVAQLNQNAFGPVWLVKNIKYVPNADAEMAALDHTSLKDTAIVQQQFSNKVSGTPAADTSAKITLLENLNDVIRYSFSSAANQFAVFSEIYYPLGWDVYVDGKKAEYVKTDYALRGMMVPAGNHKIEFRFEPRSYYLGDMLSFITGIISTLILIAAIVIQIRKDRVAPKVIQSQKGDV